MKTSWLYFMLFLLLCSCSSIERKDVPLALGLRIDDPIDPVLRSQDVETIKQLAIRHIVVELPVEAEAKSGLPKINRYARSELKKVITAYGSAGCRVTLQLTYFNYKMLFPDTLPQVEPDIWFAAYWAEIQALLQRIDYQHNVERIVLGSDFQAMEPYAGHWAKLITDVRTVYTGKVTYAADLRRVEALKFWSAADEIGIRYYFDPGKDYKVSAQKLNPIAGLVAQKLSKPIYIASANVIGKDKTLMFKNVLRFWPEEVALSGVVINSIYPATVVTFKDPYFYVPENDEFRDEIIQYNQ